jgi:integration host factor subunit beta
MPGDRFTKADISERIFAKVPINRKDIQLVLDSFAAELREILGQDGVLEIRGLGTFGIRTRKGRTKARNPRTGEFNDVGSHGVVYFKPGKELKKLAWSLRQDPE